MSVPLDPSAYESKAGVPIAVVAVVLSVAITAVGLRTYTRALLIRQFGMDDWAAIIALVFAMSSGIMVASNSIYGAGRHIAVVDPELIPKYYRTFWVSIVLYNCSLTSIKMTFLLQYYRVFGTRKMKIWILAALAFILMWSISQLLVVIFTCVPVRKFWLPKTPGTCVDLLKFWYANAAGNIVTDVLIFLLPLPAISGLKLAKPQKIMLLGIFCLGFFTCAISVVRIQYLRLSPDVTWDNVASSCWSISELCCGITCACLPTLRPLVAKWMPSLRSQVAKSTGYKEQGSGRDGAHDRSWSKESEISSGRSRAIVYPEDLELQATESEERLNSNELGAGLGHARTLSHGQYSGKTADKAFPNRNSRTMNEFGVVKPSVQTEIRAGTPRMSYGGWPRPTDGAAVRGIAVQHDVTLSR